jgi:hypothetical protein
MIKITPASFLAVSEEMQTSTKVGLLTVNYQTSLGTKEVEGNVQLNATRMHSYFSSSNGRSNGSSCRRIHRSLNFKFICHISSDTSGQSGWQESQSNQTGH